MRLRLPLLSKAQQKKVLLSPQLKIMVVLWSVLLSYSSGMPDLVANARMPSIPQSSSIAVSQLPTDGTITAATSPTEHVQVVGYEQKKRVIVKPKPTKIPITTGEQKQPGQQVASATGNGIVDALNDYRRQHGKHALSLDNKLMQFAQERANLFNSKGDLDGHAGFQDFIHNQDGFAKLGFWKLGENSGIGHAIEPKSLIENAYGSSPAHNDNQLDNAWTHVGIGVSGSATNFIFGGSKR
jgi:uncharacterized protein YkwD